jgi:DNA segregation ATPase FtsK/SpoIIIE, S-DNA-T family
MWQFGASRIAALESKIHSLQDELAAEEERARAAFNHGQRQAVATETYWSSLLEAQSLRAVESIAQLPGPIGAAWSNATGWVGWRTSDPSSAGNTLPERLRAGDLREQRNNSVFAVPGFVPFIGHHRTIIIRTDEATRQRGEALLQSLVARTALVLPHQTRYILLDPSDAGRAFPMRRHLPTVRENSGDVRRDLDGVTHDISRIIENYLEPVMN